MSIIPSGPGNAKVMLVGEMPHEQDLLRSSPFVGGFGFELTKMIRESGMWREHCYITLVMKDRVKGSRIEGCMAMAKKDITPEHVLFQGKWVLPSVVESAAQLKKEIEMVKPNVVCAFGNLALWILTGEWGVGDWRSSIMESSLVPGVKVIPTISPAVLGHSWDQRMLIVHDLKRVASEQHTPAINRTEYKFLTQPSFEEANICLTDLLSSCTNHLALTGSKRLLASDIETRAGHIACIAFAWSSRDAVCIPFMCSTNPEGYWTLEEEAYLIHLIYRLCQVVTIIGQNWNYDAQYIYRHWHFICPDVVDTMIQQHSCFSSSPKNLAYLSSMYLTDHLYWKDDRTNWTEGPKGEGENKYWIYNCTDAVRTYAIKFVLDDVIQQLELMEVNSFQQELRKHVLETMNFGLRVDHEERAKVSMQLITDASAREQWLQDVLQQPLNIRSPKQMADFFYRQMGMAPIKDRKTHSVTCNDEALQKIAKREPILAPVIRRVSDLRSLGVLNSNVVQASLDTDGRMRTSFNICGTETYRFASSQNVFGRGLNMQNITKGGKQDKNNPDDYDFPNLRKLFIPDPGHTFFDIDLDSADLRIVTWESDCAWMKAQFEAKRKPYIEVMKEYHQNPDMDKKSHPHEYHVFKSLCHGTNYLGTADGIAPRIGLDVKKTQAIQDWYFKMCPEILDWQERIKAQVSGRRYVENVFGYRMYYFGRIEGTIFNQAVAWIPQSTVACIINRGYVNIGNNLKEVQVLLQVHDSLAGQFESVHGDWALRRIKEELQIILPYDEPLIVPVDVVSSNKSWGDCG